VNITFDKNGVVGLRGAVPRDEQELFELLLMLHSENGIFSVNHEKVRKGIRYATQGQGGIIYVNMGPRIVATLGLGITMDWYSDDEYFSERWNFVHPEHRRTNYARMLLEQAKWVSDYFSRNGKKMPVQVGINSCERTEAKVRLYARHMPCVGAYFMYGDVPQKAMAYELRERSVAVQEMNRQNRAERTHNVVPTVETILKLSARG
jgi:GNAT superfamily N-acetyltransferase